MQVEFGDEIFFFEFIHCLNLTVSRSGASFLRTFNANLHVATSVCLRPKALAALCPAAALRSIPATHSNHGGPRARSARPRQRRLTPPRRTYNCSA